MRLISPQVGRSHARLIGILLAATMLQGCETVSKLNVLAAIDGPFVSPADRAVMEREEMGPEVRRPEFLAGESLIQAPASAVANEAPAQALISEPPAPIIAPPALAPEAASTEPVIVLALAPEAQPETVAEAQSVPEITPEVATAFMPATRMAPDRIGVATSTLSNADFIGPVLPPEDIARMSSAAEAGAAEAAELAILPADQGSVSQEEAEAMALVLASDDEFSADFADLMPPSETALNNTAPNNTAPNNTTADATAEALQLAEPTEPIDSEAALAIIPPDATPVTEQEAIAMAPEFTPVLDLPPEEPALAMPALAGEPIAEALAETPLEVAPEPEPEPVELALAPALDFEEEVEEATSLIGPDFLPPMDLAEDEDAAVEPAVEAAVKLAEVAPQQLTEEPAELAVAANPPATAAMARPAQSQLSPALIGPVLETPAPVARETRPPSAFDFVIEDEEQLARSDRVGVLLAEPVAPPAPPAPPAATAPPPSTDLQREAEALGLSVMTSLPAPGGSAFDLPAGTGSEAYVPFYEHVIAQLDGQQRGGGRESMLLLDPPSLDPALQTCGNRPPAVLVDLDPANGLLPLVGRGNPNTALAALLQNLRQRGVTIYWISGHGPSSASAIRQRLVTSTLDPSGTDPLIVTRFAGESKQGRRYSLGETNCLLAILGDHRADFDELYDFVIDPIMAAPLEGLVGHGWFLAPPPLD